MHIQDRGRMRGTAPARNLEEHRLDWRIGRDAVGQDTREIADHAGAGGDSGRPELRRIDAVPCLNRGDDVAHEESVVNAACVGILGPAGVPAGWVAAATLPHRLRVGDQEPGPIRPCRKTGASFHSPSRPAAAMECEYQWYRAVLVVADRNVQ